MEMPPPLHPLVAVVNYDAQKISLENTGRSFLIDFYKISFKQSFRGQVKYGQGFYDFEEGGLAFLAPNQLVKHIHDKLIERAKLMLTTTGMNISEIAYQLGFEHPQSFNKLFKRSTTISPSDFRRSFN